MARSKEERDRLAACATDRIMAGFPSVFAEQQGWTEVRTIVVMELPSLKVRSSWAVGPNALTRSDGEQLWAEIGDGDYLMRTTYRGRSVDVVVTVVDGQADMEPLDMGITVNDLLRELYGVTPALLQ